MRDITANAEAIQSVATPPRTAAKRKASKIKDEQVLHKGLSLTSMHQINPLKSTNAQLKVMRSATEYTQTTPTDQFPRCLKAS
jgi:hypothetical protein